MPPRDLDPDSAASGRRSGHRGPLRLAVGLAVGALGAGIALAPSAGAAPGAAPVAAPGAQDDPVLTARAAGPVPVADAERQAQLVLGEDERLIDVRVAGNARAVTYPLRPYRVRTAGLYTLVLPARRAPYTLDDLRRLAPQTFLVQRDGSFLLREHVLVETGATLTLAPSKPTTIRMLSGASGFVSIVSRGGRLRLLGSASAPLTFTSWDETAGGPDTTLRDGRAYLLAQGEAVVRYTRIRDLGFWSGRTGGLALVGTGAPAAGRTVDVEPAAPAATRGPRGAEVLPAGALPATATQEDSSGQISNTEVDGNAFGLFVTGTSGLVVHDVVIRNSLVHGLVLHRSVRAARIDQVRVERSAGSGVVVTRGVEGTTFSQITSAGNALDGVHVTGTPLATGPSPSGGSVRQFGNNVFTASVVENNGRTGIRVVGGTRVRLLGNSISGGHQGILVTRGADGVVVEANRVVGAAANGIQVRDATKVEISGNSVRGAPTGVHVTNASARISGNTVATATLHAVSLVGTVTGSIVEDNTLSGRGSAATDVTRITGGVVPDVTDNDTSGWQRVITTDGLLSTLMHPLTLVWAAIAILLAGSRVLVGRARRRPRAPYLESPVRTETMADISRDQRAAIEALQADLARTVPLELPRSAPPLPRPGPPHSAFDALLAPRPIEHPDGDRRPESGRVA
jgi:hypothetical protein